MGDPSSDPSIEHEPKGPAPVGEGDSVWDEPGMPPAPAAPPRPQVSAARSWTWMLLAAAGAGPWAILGAFFSGGGSSWGVLQLTVFGPAIEELMKGALVFWIVERRPYLVRSAAQVLVAVVAGALFFAVVENLLYLNLYIPHPTAGLAAWRWTVCVALHMGCSAIFGLGLVRLWKSGRSDAEVAVPYWVAAVAVHGAYNGAALLLQSQHFHF